MVEKPEPERTSVVAAEGRRIRAALVDARIAARRWGDRLRWARVIIAVLAQVVITFIAWRVWVWRAQRRRR
jgi:hypothetical protein